jgi:hypothetical protein
MNIKKSLLAFSLIELLVTILVISILAATITSGRQIIRKARLSSAQSLTYNSPINSSSNLVIWLEPTLDKSFADSEKSDGKKISIWHDINIQNSLPNNASQVISAHKPTYVNNGINSLPVVRFSKNNNKYLSFDGSKIANSNYTLIIVEQRSDDQNYNYFLCGTSNSVANSNLLVGYFFDTAIFWGQNFNDYKVIDIPAYNNRNIPRIHSFYFNVISGKNYYLNEVSKNLIAVNSPVANQGLNSYQGAAVGCNPDVGNPSYVGDIAEVIIFGRALKDSERISIENYLKDKWGI